MAKEIKKVNIALLGLGTVGGGTYDILTKNREMILKTQGVDICVTKVLDKSKDLVIKRGIPKADACDNIDEILNDKSISIVVETIGGIEPAKSFIEKSLNAGKSVVTANKELISKHWKDLEPLARKNGVGLYFEASCAGGIPIIRVLQQGMQANNIKQIMGIVNGTTNYILTKMTEQNLPYKDVLLEAQSLGFAEADPTADVEAYDAMYKLSILSSLAFHTAVPFTSIYREGITSISADDIQNAKNLGYIIKLLAIGKKNDGNIEARVHPCFVPISHPLASVRNEFNAVFLSGDSVDDIMLYGRGAGSYPTGSAVVSDIVFASKADNHFSVSFEVTDKVAKDINMVTDFESAYYISLSVVDKAGVLSKITDKFGQNSVSISQMVQSSAKDGYAKLVFLTHTTTEKSLQTALKQIKELAEVKSADSVIRVI